MLEVMLHDAMIAWTLYKRVWAANGSASGIFARTKLLSRCHDLDYRAIEAVKCHDYEVAVLAEEVLENVGP